MAFKTVVANTSKQTFVTVSVTGVGACELYVASSAYRAIGEPRAVAFEWDDDESLLRISAASPESRESSPLTTGLKKRCSITNLLNSLGVSIPHTVRIPATPDGPLAVIVDLSEYRSR